MQVPRDVFYTASMSGVVSSQLGPFGHKPEVLGEMLAGRSVVVVFQFLVCLLGSEYMLMHHMEVQVYKGLQAAVLSLASEYSPCLTLSALTTSAHHHHKHTRTGRRVRLSPAKRASALLAFFPPSHSPPPAHCVEQVAASAYPRLRASAHRGQRLPPHIIQLSPLLTPHTHTSSQVAV